jgi:hypothetical protein
MMSGIENFDSTQSLRPNKKNTQKSIFTRLNHLIEYLTDNPTNLAFDKRRTLVTLITSFYLNLSRNEEARDLLLSLHLFRRLTELMESDLVDNKFTNKTALCYTNTIFAKLLKFPDSRKICIDEGGHNLFIRLLQDPDNRNLYMETLDTIKLFLT